MPVIEAVLISAVLTHGIPIAVAAGKRAYHKYDPKANQAKAIGEIDDIRKLLQEAEREHIEFDQEVEAKFYERMTDLSVQTDRLRASMASHSSLKRVQVCREGRKVRKEAKGLRQEVQALSARTWAKQKHVMNNKFVSLESIAGRQIIIDTSIANSSQETLRDLAEVPSKTKA